MGLIDTGYARALARGLGLGHQAAAGQREERALDLREEQMARQQMLDIAAEERAQERHEAQMADRTLALGRDQAMRDSAMLRFDMLFPEQTITEEYPAPEGVGPPYTAERVDPEYDKFRSSFEQLPYEAQEPFLTAAQDAMLEQRFEGLKNDIRVQRHERVLAQIWNDDRLSEQEKERLWKAYLLKSYTGSSTATSQQSIFGLGAVNPQAAYHAVIQAGGTPQQARAAAAQAGVTGNVSTKFFPSEAEDPNAGRIEQMQGRLRILQQRIDNIGEQIEAAKRTTGEGRGSALEAIQELQRLRLTLLAQYDKLAARADAMYRGEETNPQMDTDVPATTGPGGPAEQVDGVFQLEPEGGNARPEIDPTSPAVQQIMDALLRQNPHASEKQLADLLRQRLQEVP